MLHKFRTLLSQFCRRWGFNHVIHGYVMDTGAIVRLLRRRRNRRDKYGPMSQMNNKVVMQGIHTTA